MHADDRDFWLHLEVLTIRRAVGRIKYLAGSESAMGAFVNDITPEAAVNGIVEVAGPEAFRMDEFVRRALTARHDPRRVVTDPHAPYFGVELGERTLLPGDGAILAETRFEDWLAQSLTSQK